MPDTGEKFLGAHQESIATAVALIDDDNSNLIANLIEASLFDAPFDDIVSRCIEHRRAHKRPPGRGHIDDVFAYVLEDKSHKSYRQYDMIIGKMVQQAERLDTGYVLTTVSDFIRLRLMRQGIAQAVERYQKGGAGVIEDLEDIFRQNLKIRNQERDYGFTLADTRALNFLDRDARDYCNLGVKELNECGAVPTRRELLAFLSPPNRGKSFFLTHCGKHGLMKGWSVVHYTLENSDDMTAQRYFQTLFSGVRRAGTYRYVGFNRQDEEAVKLQSVSLTPEFVVEDVDQASAYLSGRIKERKSMLSRLRIRRFPSGRMTYEMLERDLDEMLIAHQFEPDMVIIDMPQLMKLPRRDKDYAGLDELVTNLRGLAVERNLAMVVPQQGNRSSNAASSVQAQHGSGSFGVFGIADNLITYSQTPSEEQHGLARLYTQKVRNDRARMTVLISQHYDTGNFCMDSHPMTSKLRDLVKEYTGYQQGEAESEDDEYEEPGGARR